MIHKNPHTYGESRPPLSPLVYIVAPYIFLAFVLAIRPRPSLLLRLSAWVGLTAFLLYGTKFDVGSDFDNWSVGIVLLGLSFTAFVLLFLWDPVVQCRHETQQKDEEIMDMSYLKRAYYMLCVIVTYRGVGWNYQVFLIFSFIGKGYS